MNRLENLELALHYLRQAGDAPAARHVEYQMETIRLEMAEDLRSKSRKIRNRVSSGITPGTVFDMGYFGVRIGKIYWIPGLLNDLENRLDIVRALQALAEDRWTTRRTRRFATALRKTTDCQKLIDKGYSGYVVSIEIASTDPEYDNRPHWSEYTSIPVYVDDPKQALRLAPVLRDREVISAAGGAADAGQLWTDLLRRPGIREHLMREMRDMR